MNQKVRIAKGQDWVIEFRVREGDGKGDAVKAKLTADAANAATALTIDGRHPAFASGDKFVFADAMVVTCSGTCAAGATSLPVNAIAGPLRTGDVLEKLQDLTDYTVKMEVLGRRGDATPVIADSSITITLADQTGDARGKVQASGLAATTTGIDAKTYYGAVARRNSGSARPLAELDFEVYEAGFLS